MIEINKAEIIEQPINIRSKTPMKKKELYGTEALAKVSSGIFELIKLGREKFGDGFDLTDLSIVISMYSPIKEISSSWNQAKLEVNDLSPEELQANTQFIIDGLLEAFDVELTSVGNKDIDKLMYVILTLGDLIDIIAKELEDGADFKDLQRLPEVVKLMLDIAFVMEEAVEEAKDLSGKEIGTVASALAYRIHTMLLR